MVGVTPEAETLDAACQGKKPETTASVSRRQLREAWAELSTARSGPAVDAVILGCPHFSFAEFDAVADTVSRLGDVRAHENVQLLVFASATTVELARRAGLLEPLKRFGATIVRDTCPFHSPVVAAETEVIMTNSGKCAYYAPGELNVGVVFGALDACVKAAVAGRAHDGEGPW
jgi:predicted aconitase